MGRHGAAEKADQRSVLDDSNRPLVETRMPTKRHATGGPFEGQQARRDQCFAANHTATSSTIQSPLTSPSVPGRIFHPAGPPPTQLERSSLLPGEAALERGGFWGASNTLQRPVDRHCPSEDKTANRHKHCAGVAQLVEHQLAMLDVAGSNPVSRSTLLAPRVSQFHLHRLEQTTKDDGTPVASAANTAGQPAGVAQLVEHQLAMLDVAGSNPVSRSNSTPP